MNAESHDWYPGDDAWAWRLGFGVTVADVRPDHSIVVVGVGGERHVVSARCLERI